MSFILITYVLKSMKQLLLLLPFRAGGNDIERV